MTAHELAKKLLAGPDLPVHLAYPAGDYIGTTLAPPVRSISDSFDMIVYSAKFRTDELVTDMEKAEKEHGQDMRSVIVLS